jgi:predicted membrane channel-forming protein YqfA (hemolysin III family)
MKIIFSHFKRGGGRGFIYLLFFCKYFFVRFFTSGRGEGGMGFFFFLLCYFLYYVLSFCYRVFYSCKGRGCGFIFHLKN